MEHIGIDFGSKLAGTTVIAFSDGAKQLHLIQSQKKQDADVVIEKFCQQNQPRLVFIDAPLSLPEVYNSQSNNDDYFYRQADRETGAMSPMFLGGLTARAMRLHNKLKKAHVQCVESYPKQLVELIQIESHYKNHIQNFLIDLSNHFPDYQLPEASNWHQVDALLAYFIGVRFYRGQHKTYGQEAEGQIIA